MTACYKGRLALNWLRYRHAAIAGLAVVGIAAWAVVRFGLGWSPHLAHRWLQGVLLLGGVPLIVELSVKLARREWGADLLAGISIVASVLLGEYLAGALVVLMLSGGETLEAYAVRSASSVLAALSRRMPSVAHRKRDSTIEDVSIDEIVVGDEILVFPHESCPVDGTVIEGHGVMDESYLTGEPFLIQKTPGASVFSGAINGESALTIRADKLAGDSRFAQIMHVMQESQQRRPRLRRMGDQFGALYTPLAVAIGLIAWGTSGDPIRFLAVMVIATPCPLLIGIPVAIIGSISLAARRTIVIRDPVVLERAPTCRTMIFDKTGTLTYGEPELVNQIVDGRWNADTVLSLVASIEQYSKHPLARAIRNAARLRRLAVHEARQISEPPGQGLTGEVRGHTIRITSRKQLLDQRSDVAGQLPPPSPGLECIILIDQQYAATYQFRDRPRREGARFIDHLGPKHRVDRVILLSGDRESEVRYLADLIGVREVHAEKTPEQKLDIVRREAARAPTLFMGDGINDAPALLAATVGIAFGQHSDVTTEAAGAVIMDTTLEKVDELLHISARMRTISLQTALGGVGLSLCGMAFAAAGYLPPVYGALAQELIDVFAVLNALRAAWPPQTLRDF